VVRSGRPRLVSMLVLSLASLAPACGGGGGSDGTTTTTRCIGYSSTPPAAGQVVGRQGAASACGLVAVEMVAAGVNDVFAAEFEVNYNPAVMAFDSLSDTGSYLKTGGVTTQTAVGTSAGKVTVGITRVAPATGINFPASGELLITLFFRRATNSMSTAAVTFTNANLLDSGTPPQPIPGVVWINGTATVQ